MIVCDYTGFSCAYIHPATWTHQPLITPSETDLKSMFHAQYVFRRPSCVTSITLSFPSCLRHRLGIRVQTWVIFGIYHFENSSRCSQLLS